MNSLRRWPLCRSCIAEMSSRGSCWLVLCGVMLFAWLMPMLTPWEENPQILQPARAQASWVYLWLMMFSWLPFQAAIFGHRVCRDGLLDHLSAAGSKKFSLCLQITAAVVIWLLVLVLLGVLICGTVCLPKRHEEAVLWWQLLAQYGLLYSLCGIPLLWLAVALGTRVSEIIAFLMPVGLLFIGLFGAVWFVPLLEGSDNGLTRTFWMMLPHYHLADLTPRLVFKLGPLSTADFTTSVLILSSQGAALILFGLCLFRTRP